MARKRAATKPTAKRAPARAAARRTSSLLDTRIIYCGDCVDQLAKLPDGCVDLIYIDPPFNSNRNYEVFWGETKEKRAFEDRHASTQAYIDYMRPRCVELARVLKKTGSFYYHCDWHASHYVKVMLDQTFGFDQFLNEIVWYYRGAGVPKTARARRHDIILHYATTKDQQFFNPDPIRQPYAQATKERFSHYIGNVRGDKDYGQQELNPLGKHPDDVITHIQPIAPSARARLGYPTQKPIELLKELIEPSTKPGQIVLDAFCGCGTTLVAAQNLDRQWIGIDISPTACRVMAKRLRDECMLREDEDLWRAGHGFVVRDLPWTEGMLRKMPPFEFENWAVIALGGIPNKTQVGDMGIDGRIFPVAAAPSKAATPKGKTPAFEEFLDHWYPIQVKQKDKVGRPDIDSFEAVMTREDREKGFFVAFDYTRDALREIDAFFRKSGKSIIALTVHEILEEEIARKLA